LSGAPSRQRWLGLRTGYDDLAWHAVAPHNGGGGSDPCRMDPLADFAEQGKSWPHAHRRRPDFVADLRWRDSGGCLPDYRRPFVRLQSRRTLTVFVVGFGARLWRAHQG